MAEMEAVAGAVGAIGAAARVRLESAMASVTAPGDAPAFAALVEKRDALLAYA
jgi:beta-N-acetylhexosaminidase